MIIHLCNPKVCWNKQNTDILFDLKQNYPQGHFIKTDLSNDDLIIRTGMVESKTQLRKLYQQKAVKIFDNGIQIGKKILLFEDDPYKDINPKSGKEASWLCERRFEYFHEKGFDKRTQIFKEMSKS